MRTVGAALLAASVLLATACGGSAPSGAAAPPAATVQARVPEASLTTVTLTAEAAGRLGIETAPVEERALARSRTVSGEVIAPPGSATMVTAPFAGTLEAAASAPVPGANVTRGQPLFRLVPLAPAERDARVDAERAVGEATARQQLASQRVRRAETLVQDGAGSRRAVEEASADLAVAEADLKAARDRLADRGNAVGGGISIDAPFGALVLNVHVMAGQAVAAGAPLVDLGRLDTVWVRVPVYVGESNEIDKAAPVSIVELGSAADVAGRPARPVPAPPSADASTAAVNLYYALANTGTQLRPGQRVGVRLTRQGATASLVVPTGALLQDAFGGTWVYEARDGNVFTRQRVQVADVVDGFAVLTQGPPTGTRVVTAGAAEIFGTEFGIGR